MLNKYKAAEIASKNLQPLHPDEVLLISSRLLNKPLTAKTEEQLVNDLEKECLKYKNRWNEILLAFSDDQLHEEFKQDGIV